MKTQIQNLSPPQIEMGRRGWGRLPAVLALASLLASSAPSRLQGQTFTVIHSFSTGDGSVPEGSLILSSNVLYGATYFGGTYGDGTVFKVNTDGTGFTTLYDFDGPSAGGSDGTHPYAGLLLSGNTLYGTTLLGGSSLYSGGGTVFEVNTDGTGFATLYSFSLAQYPGYMNADGTQPTCQLVMSGDKLFGTTPTGGSGGNGTVFAFDLAGGGLTALHDFSPVSSNNTNSDGAQPIAGLVLATNGYTLYGTTVFGGPGGSGTVFAINTDGTGFTTVYSFGSAHFVTNSDGAFPDAGLIISGQTLYGTANAGGVSGQGTVFKVNTDGSSFATLHNFTAATGHVSTDVNLPINNDGAWPRAALLLAGNTLYGTATSGGASGSGTVFAVNTDGSGFMVLHNFTSINGAGTGGLVLSSNTLYGTAGSYFTVGSGTIFTISFSPQLTITPSSTGVVLTWPTNYAGFDYTGYTLQSTTNLASAVWTAVSPAPLVINGQNTVTNPVSGTQQFFRLRQ